VSTPASRHQSRALAAQLEFISCLPRENLVS
jgi:hypothetical protein